MAEVKAVAVKVVAVVKQQVRDHQEHQEVLDCRLPEEHQDLLDMLP